LEKAVDACQDTAITNRTAARLWFCNVNDALESDGIAVIPLRGFGTEYQGGERTWVTAKALYNKSKDGLTLQVSYLAFAGLIWPALAITAFGLGLPATIAYLAVTDGHGPTIGTALWTTLATGVLVGFVTLAEYLRRRILRDIRLMQVPVDAVVKELGGRRCW
jgi:hypothetical protein